MSDGLRWVEACESTNTLATEHFDDPEVRGVGADVQTGGRGRRGRAWSSPGGGLYFTWIARPAFDPGLGGALPLLAGVALVEACAELGVTATLKWPNDVLLDDRKLAGVLCEAQPVGSGWAAAVGIGVNLLTPAAGWPPEVPAVALDERLEAPPTPRALARDLVTRLERWLETVARAGLAPVVATWERHGPKPGAPLRRGETLGTYAGLAPNGGLRLQTPQGEEVVHAGDVELLPC